MDFNNGKYLDELFVIVFIAIENNGIINALASTPNSSNASGAHDQKLNTCDIGEIVTFITTKCILIHSRFH
jgi:hypothetical protein